MIEVFLYSFGLVLMGGVVYIIVATRRTYIEARNKQVKIDWALAQLERALAQTKSEDETNVLAGIQCLSTLNIPEIRFKALQRLDELTDDKNPRLAKYAESGILRLCKSSVQSECPRVDTL